MCGTQEPAPGPNAFKYNGKTIATYPRSGFMNGHDPTIA